MDAHRFDSLARTLTTAGSRRQALALALSGAIAPLLARESTEAHNALLKCKKLKGEKKKTCVKKAKKHNAQEAANAVPAAAPPGDSAPPPPSCEGVDLQTDARNCGECGKECSFPHATARCVSGTCQIHSCDPGFVNCSPSLEDGCETELGTPEHCSTCSNVCDAPRNGTTMCKSGPAPGPGTCVYACDPGFEDCFRDGRIACCSTNPIDFCQLMAPAVMKVGTSQRTSSIYGRIYEAGVTEASGESEAITAQVGYGPVGSDPRSASTWRYQPAFFFTQINNNEDEYQGAFTAPSTAGTYAYVYRFSLDAGNTWTYCDLNGSSGNSNTDFDASNLGLMTVE